jgi:uncharacterized membrane protein YkvA (DUF1232 family)
MLHPSRVPVEDLPHGPGGGAVPDWTVPVAGVAGGLLLAWLALVAVLWAARPDDLRAGELLRLLPDVLRLVRRLAADRTLPRGVRLRLWLLLGYLALPVDLVPDVIPVIGYADDAVAVALVLRSVVRRAGPDAVARHWPGTEAGLAALRRGARLPG